MNFYMVVEGEVGEKQVYGNWIPYVNPALRCALTINDVTEDSFYIISGGGYPNLLEVIDSAVEDMSILVRQGTAIFDRLVIAVDSEEESHNLKYKEIDSIVLDSLARLRLSHLDYKIIVQHFCLETWALGNKRLVTNNIKQVELGELINHHNVAKYDPELLTPKDPESMNRAQTATKYLKLLLNNKNKSLTYNKGNPGALLHMKYFEQIKQRADDTGHIPSFKSFIDAFQ